MKPRMWRLLVLSAIVAAGGCNCFRNRSGNGQEALERENRELQDKVYDLEYKLEDAQADLEKSQQERDRLRDLPASGSSRRPATDSTDDGGSDQSGAGGDASGADSSSSGPPDPDDLGPPDVDLPANGTTETAPPFEGPPEMSAPDPSVPEGFHDAQPEAEDPESADPRDMPAAEGSHEGADPADIPGNLENPAESEDDSDAVPGPTESAGPDGRGPGVRQITLNQQFTGVWRRSASPTPEGLSILVEPRDADGRLVNTPGEISVVAIDPSQQGDVARVARWDFTAQQAADHYRETRDGKGLHFELTWPKGAPSASRLSVYVRYVTGDGRKLVAEQSVELVASQPVRDKPPASGKWSRSPKKSTQAKPAVSRSRRKAPRRRGASASRDNSTWSPYR